MRSCVTPLCVCVSEFSFLFSLVACVIDIICLSTVDELCCALFDDFIHLTLRHMLFTMFLSIILSFHISTISATFLFIIKIYAFLISHLLGFGFEIIHIVLQFSISSYEGMIITFINVCVWL